MIFFLILIFSLPLFKAIQTVVLPTDPFECPYPFSYDFSTDRCICPLEVDRNCAEKFDESTCSCVCRQTDVICPWPYEWSTKQCKCIYVCEVQDCPPGYVFDEKLCRCVCEKFNTFDCPYLWYKNPDKCECECFKQDCPANFIFNEKFCNCTW